MSRIELRNARLPSGITLQFAETGPRTGTPVLFLHGLTDSLHSWDTVMPLLSGEVRALALSQRGHGRSDKPAGGYHTADFARDAAAFIREMDAGPAWVVGHSMGATNAMRLALDAPELVRGVVLVNAFARFRGNEAAESLHREVVVPLADPIDPQVARDFQLSTMATPVDPAFVDRMVAQSLMVPARIWRAALEGLLEDDVGDLRAIRAPVQLHWGDQDIFAGRDDQVDLLARLRGADLVVYPGAGHALHWEQPARFAERLMAFIRATNERSTDRSKS